MRLIEAAGTEAEPARYEPEALAGWMATPIRGGRYHLRRPALPVRAEPFDAIAFFTPILRISFDVAGEGVIRFTVARGGQVTCDIPFLVVKRRVIDASGEEAGPVGIL